MAKEAKAELPATDKLLWMYRTMVQIRQFEERVYQLFLQGLMPGTLHQYQGQEAVAVGVCAALSRDDYITSTHRPHGHSIAKGVGVNSMMAELFARDTGCCRAKGGSMHMGDIAVGATPAIAIVAGGIPIAAGMGLAFKLQNTEQVVACFFGDGAVNEGAFHEGANLAAIWKLPLIFVCENNLYAASTPMQLTTPVPIAQRASGGYAIPAETVDGNDVLEVYRAAREAVARARSGAGPTLLECRTYRHGGHSRSDPGAYRPKEEVEAWLEKDPIPRFKKALLERRLADEEPFLAIEQEVKEEIEAAVAFARGSPAPRPEDALLHVYGEDVP
jgi:TPP-dependent pyruvate/acetoin dehydrogenase alpha subunit